MISRIKDLATRYVVKYWNPMPPREFFQQVREDDRGSMSTEMVIIVAVIAVFTLGVVTFIGSQIMDKAHGFHF